MSVTINSLLNYCNSMYEANAKYLWGADGEIGSKEFLDYLINKFGASNYVGIKAQDIEGYPCMDCSGLLTPITHINQRAVDYYNKCTVKGSINNIPSNKVCLVFREENKKITHIGIYMGNGNTCEMWNGCEIKTLNKKKWTYYGFPSWLEEQPDKKELKVDDKIKLKTNVYVYNNAIDAIKGTHPLSYKYNSGEYYVYKLYNGSVNVTRKKGKAGAWTVLEEEDYDIIL